MDKEVATKEDLNNITAKWLEEHPEAVPSTLRNSKPEWYKDAAFDPVKEAEKFARTLPDK